MSHTAYDTFMLAFRIATLLAAVLLGSAFILAGAQAALAGNITLKPTSIIEGQTIRLGDIFSGLASNEDYVLGPAPQPGHDMTLDARTLMRIALALDLPWRPASTADTVTLRTSAVTVGENEMISALEQGLRDQGLTGRFDIVFQGTAPRFVLPGGQPASVEVSALKFDAQKSAFSATLSSPSVSNPVRSQTVSGSIRQIVEIPVLKNTLRNGDVIGTQDIQWIDVFNREIQHDYILAEQDIIGKTPRRMVLAGKPVRAIEIQSPQVIRRGDEVTLIFGHGAMTLTAKGRASQDGAEGDIVRVVNNTSSRAVDGIVTGEREVTVQ